MSDADQRRRFVDDARTRALGPPPERPAEAGRPDAGARSRAAAQLQPLDVGRALARELFARVPNADPLVAAVAPGFAAILQGAVKQARAPTSSVGALLAPLIQSGAPPPPVPGDEDEQNPQAAVIARLLAPVVGAALTAATPAALPLTVAGAALTAATLRTDFDALAQTEPFKTVYQALKKSGVIDLAGTSLGGGTLAASFYTPDKVRRVLRSLAKFLEPVVGEVVTYVEEELKQAALRSVLAEAVSRLSLALPFSVKSNRDIGNHVHKELQEGYVRLYSKTRDIVVERCTPDDRVELFVIGPTTSLVPMPLQDVAIMPARDPLYFFRALRGAMNGFKLHKDSWLRADLVDAYTNEIWEIKPVGNLFGGVWQETLYRVSFNVIRMIVLVGQPEPLRLAHFMRGGDFWFDFTRRAFGNEVTEIALHQQITVTRHAGRPAVATPFQVGALPGLIGYFVLQGPNVPRFQEVLETILIPALLAAIAKILKDLEKLGERLGEAVAEARRVLGEMAEALKRFAEAIWPFVVAIAVVGAFIAFFPAGLGGLAVAGAAALIILIVGEVVGEDSGDGPGKGGGDRDGKPTDVRIGPVMVRGVPRSKVPQFLAEVQRQMHDIVGAAADELQRRPPAVA
ncbi:MAG TPA: hypothetical protein VF064_02190 [Pyrinomonadaceae bacterium]